MPTTDRDINPSSDSPFDFELSDVIRVYPKFPPYRVSGIAKYESGNWVLTASNQKDSTIRIVETPGGERYLEEHISGRGSDAEYERVGDFDPKPRKASFVERWWGVLCGWLITE